MHSRVYEASTMFQAAPQHCSRFAVPRTKPANGQPPSRGLAAAAAAELMPAQDMLHSAGYVSSGAFVLPTSWRQQPEQSQQQLRVRQPHCTADLHNIHQCALQLQQQCHGLISEQPQLPRKLQKNRQHKAQQRQQRVVDDQRMKFHSALHGCHTWEQLVAFLQAEKQQHRVDVQHEPRWRQVSSGQALLALQQATQLASKLHRGKQQHNLLNSAAAAAKAHTHHPLDQLQPVFSELVKKAAAGVAPGDAVAAAQVLRAAWKLQDRQQSRQQQYHLHELLEHMSSGWKQQPAAAPLAKPAAGAASNAEEDFQIVRNANLLADVSAAVVQLQLQPSCDWLRWYRDTSITMMSPQQQDNLKQLSAGHQLQQQQAAAVTSWFLVNTLQLAQYVSVNIAEQQQHHSPLDAQWMQAWSTAAAALEHPFSTNQLLLVASAAAQLRMQLLSSFLTAHLHPQAVAEMSALQVMRLLKLLAQLQQQQQQRFELPPSWLHTAAEALPTAAAAVEQIAGVGSQSTAVCQLLPGAVVAAAQLQLPINQAGSEQLLSALLVRVHRKDSPQAHGKIPTESPALVCSTRDIRGGSVHQSTCALRHVSPGDACTAVVALAQLSKHQQLQPPSQQSLRQLQQQLRPLLMKSDTSSIISLLWALVVVWRAPLGVPFLSMLFGVTVKRLRSCSANELKLLVIAVTAAAEARATAGAPAVLQVPSAWLRRLLQCTATVMAAKQAAGSSSSGVAARFWWSPPQQQPPALGDALTAKAVEHAGFLSNAACCLARLKVTPDRQWQAVWRQQVMCYVRFMPPDQLVDVLYAAAVWADRPAAAVGEKQVAAAAGLGRSAQPAAAVPEWGQLPRKSLVGTDTVQQAPGATVALPSAATVVAPKPTAAQSAHHLLPRPAFAVPSTSEAPATAAAAGPSPTVMFNSTIPPEAWVNTVLVQLSRQLQHCRPKQLTTVLWCLNKLQFRASVPWLDAVYDRLMVQLPLCSLLQLQQLLRGLLHQRLELAPARIDLVLQAALQRMQQGPRVSTVQTGDYSRGSRDSGREYACTEQQLVWQLQLVVKLRHDPDPDWGRALARIAEDMLFKGNSRSSGFRSFEWDAPLLTDLIVGFTQLGVLLPDSWLCRYRAAIWTAGLRTFSGFQLARLLSALAASHCSAVAKPFLQQLLRQLARQLPAMDPHALGLAGVAVGQLGLVPAKQWSERYMQRVHMFVQHKVRVAVSDVSNLQRSVQYLRWCASCSSSRPLNTAIRVGRRQLRHGKVGRYRPARQCAIAPQEPNSTRTCTQRTTQPMTATRDEGLTQSQAGPSGAAVLQ